MYKSLNLIQGFKINFNARWLAAGQFLSTKIEYYFNVGKIVDLLLLGVWFVSGCFVRLRKQTTRKIVYVSFTCQCIAIKIVYWLFANLMFRYVCFPGCLLNQKRKYVYQKLTKARLPVVYQVFQRLGHCSFPGKPNILE